MDEIIMQQLFGEKYKGCRVFVTGHTGFKGSWLSLWLKSMGAIVKGYSLAPDTEPSHWDLLRLDVESVYADIRDKDRLYQEIACFKPDIVFHMAAQPLVRKSYKDPVSTYEINVIGTLNLFEACRRTDSVKAIVNITTDKCYENKEWIWGYRENDRLGGYDPYSSSKACSEILTSSYRNSFFNLNDFEINHNVLLASVRAGNVIGGGDWAEDRLIPDIMKATAQGDSVLIRNPKATRPWQHVLEPLSGYLLLGQRLLEKEKDFAVAWNFGPDDDGNVCVGDVATSIKKEWDDINIRQGTMNKECLHEATLLMLDCSRAKTLLKWKPVWGNKVFNKTSVWYKAFYTNNNLISKQQLLEYITDAENSNVVWIG
jgi:CDP-glucose 4,6-dehydratase